MSDYLDVGLQNNDEILNKNFDVIIVGAGLGGLNAGCCLALESKKVLVLEKNGFIGGRCSSYKREGYISYKRSYKREGGIHVEMSKILEWNYRAYSS